MSKIYNKITGGIEGRIDNGYAYVRVTNMVHGCLEQGGRLNRVYRAKTDCKTINDLVQPYNDYGACELDIIMDSSNVIRHGDIIR